MAVQPLNVRRLDVRPFWADTVRLGGQVLHDVVFTRRVCLALLCSVRLLHCSAVAEFSWTRSMARWLIFVLDYFLFGHRFPQASSAIDDDDQKICRYQYLFFVHPTL